MLNPVAAENVLRDGIGKHTIYEGVVIMGWLIYAQLSDAAHELEYLT